MKVGIKVGDVMTRRFVSVNPSTSIEECAKAMVKKRVGSLIVTENKVLKGIVTEGDIIKAVVKNLDLKSTKVSKIMTKRIYIKKLHLCRYLKHFNRYPSLQKQPR